MIKVQTGLVVMLSTDQFVSIDTISGADRAFPMIWPTGALAGEAGPDSWEVGIDFDGTDAVRLRRFSALPYAAATWYVVEATDDEFAVQHVQGVLGVGALSTTFTLATPVDRSRTMLVGSVRMRTGPTGTAFANQSYVRWRFVDDSTIEVVRQAGANISLQVVVFAVEWAAEQGVEVHHLSHVVDGNLRDPVPIAHGIEGIALERTMVLASFSHAQNGLEQCSVAVHLPDADHVAYERHWDTTSYSSRAETQLITFPLQRGVVVQHLRETLADLNDAYHTFVSATSWDPDAALPYLSATSGGTGTAFPRNLWRPDTLDPFKVRCARSHVGQPAKLSLSIANFGGWSGPLSLVLDPAAPAALEELEGAGPQVLGVDDLPAGPTAAQPVDPAALLGDLSFPSGVGSPAARAEAIAAGDRLEVVVDGARYAGWQQVSLSRSIDAAAGSFTLQVAERRGFPIRRGASIGLQFGGRPVLEAFVDAVQINWSATAHSILLTGRERTADLIDCSAPTVPSEYLGAKFGQVVGGLAGSFGVPVDVQEGADSVFGRFAIQPGETAWSAIDRACRLRGVLASGTGLGGLRVALPGTDRAAVALVWGRNILEASYAADDTDRHREYIVQGQQPGNDLLLPEQSAGAEGRAFDLAARAGRRLLIMAETGASDALATQRAEWEAAVRAARSVELRIRLRGWLQLPDGDPWEPGLLVPVRIPPLEIDGDLIIRSVDLSYGPGQGYQTTLTLTRPDAYRRSPEVETAQGWDTIIAELQQGGLDLLAADQPSDTPNDGTGFESPE